MLSENFSRNVSYFTRDCERGKQKNRGVLMVLGENSTN